MRTKSERARVIMTRTEFADAIQYAKDDIIDNINNHPQNRVEVLIDILNDARSKYNKYCFAPTVPTRER
jgi:hypothetical protein